MTTPILSKFKFYVPSEEVLNGMFYIQLYCENSLLGRIPILFTPTQLSELYAINNTESLNKCETYGHLSLIAVEDLPDKYIPAMQVMDDFTFDGDIQTTTIDNMVYYGVKCFNSNGESFYVYLTTSQLDYIFNKNKEPLISKCKIHGYITLNIYRELPSTILSKTPNISITKGGEDK